MDKDVSKAEQRGDKDRRQVDNPDYGGPERRIDDRRKGKSKAK